MRERMHLNPGDLDSDELREISVLGEAVQPVAPRPEAKSRLMSLVSGWETLKPIADVRPYDGGWIGTGAPGVDMRSLFRDRQTGRNTLLLRMAPGATLPAHVHGDDEQCFVVQGDVRWGEVVYRAGDFVVMAKESRHPEIRSEEGNLLLLVCGHNEFE